eukprot:5090641-Amphidinium_carterae.1
MIPLDGKGVLGEQSLERQTSLGARGSSHRRSSSKIITRLYSAKVINVRQIRKKYLLQLTIS